MSDNDVKNLANSIIGSIYNISKTMPKTERFLATITNDNPWTIRRIGANQDLPPEMIRIHKKLLPRYEKIEGITFPVIPPNDEPLSNAGGSVLPQPHHHTHTHNIAPFFIIQDIFPSLAIGDIVIVKSYNGNQIYEADQRDTLGEANQAILNDSIKQLEEMKNQYGG